MQERSIFERVETLERKVEALETLPDRTTRVELQLVQLRDEMRVEFSAIRGEGGESLTLAVLRDSLAAVRGEMRAEFAAVRGEMGAEFAAVRGEMGVELAAIRGAGGEGLTLAALREEIRASNGARCEFSAMKSVRAMRRRAVTCACCTRTSSPGSRSFRTPDPRVRSASSADAHTTAAAPMVPACVRVDLAPQRPTAAAKPLLRRA